MQELLLFLERQQTWIYIGLGGVGLFYVRAAVQAYIAVQRARFRLEREQARQSLIRSGVMVGLLSLGVLVVFILTSFISPALPADAERVPVPTVNLLATPDVRPTDDEAFLTATPLPEGDIAAAACSNPDATIRIPEDGDQLRGVIEILGTANIDNFAFYTLEYRSITSEGTWRAIMAGTQQVCEAFCEEEELLGSWDTSLVPPADYALRLVVTDTSGNAPQPCQIRVSVVP